MLFLLSSTNGGPKGFAPISSSAELPCERQLHKFSHGVGFQVSFRFYVFCEMKCFTVAKVEILPTTS